MVKSFFILLVSIFFCSCIHQSDSEHLLFGASDFKSQNESKLSSTWKNRQDMRLDAGQSLHLSQGEQEGISLSFKERGATRWKVRVASQKNSWVNDILLVHHDLLLLAGQFLGKDAASAFVMVNHNGEMIDLNAVDGCWPTSVVLADDQVYFVGLMISGEQSLCTGVLDSKSHTIRMQDSMPLVHKEWPPLLLASGKKMWVFFQEFGADGTSTAFIAKLIDGKLTAKRALKSKGIVTAATIIEGALRVDLKGLKSGESMVEEVPLP